MGENASEEIPRAKRLKLLREAKERKERLERGETIEEPAPAEPQAPIKNDEEAPKQSNEVAGQPDTQEVEGGAKDADAEEDGDLLNLAPKRANWDIERDIAPMLKKLERRTQHAIVEILREKMAAEQEEEDEDEEGESDEGDE